MKPLTQEQFEAIREFLKPIIGNGNAIKEFANEFKPKPEQPTLIPFNLEVALANPDRVVYRDGSKPLEWHWLEKYKGAYPIISVYNSSKNCTHTEKGFIYNSDEDNIYDLSLLTEPKKEYWVNVYNKNASDFGFHFADTYTSEKEAVDNVFNSKSYTYLKTISFTI